MLRGMSTPNIVYILADDMGYGDVSCLNPESKIQTRHIDRLAAEGMRCRDAHATSAVCTPSRYGILTGRYNWRSWLKSGVTFGYSGPVIEEGRMTVADLLRDHGYATACVGKWHLGWTWQTRSDDPKDVDFAEPIEHGPCTRGFDSYFGISASLDMAPYVYVRDDRATAVPDRETPGEEGKRFYRPGPIAPDFEIEHVLPRLTDEAEGFIDRSSAAGQPFFLYFPLPAPHTPIVPTHAFQGVSGVNEYADFCLHVDDVVGRILAALERNGVADDTILVFTADNGCSPMADFDELASAGHHPSYHFRGHKADIYEGGHRVPFVIRWPNGIAPNSTCEETICLADLMATAAELVGTTLPENAGEDSVSNLPVWQGRPLDGSLREATVHHSVNGSFSIRRGRWKLEMCAGSGGWSHPQPGPACEGLPPVQLYDLDADIGERRNLEAEQPELVAELRDLLTQYICTGRSTPGPAQPNTGGTHWEQLWWLTQEDAQRRATAASRA